MVKQCTSVWANWIKALFVLTAAKDVNSFRKEFFVINVAIDFSFTAISIIGVRYKNIYFSPWSWSEFQTACSLNFAYIKKTTEILAIFNPELSWDLLINCLLKWFWTFLDWLWNFSPNNHCLRYWCCWLREAFKRTPNTSPGFYSLRSQEHPQHKTLRELQHLKPFVLKSLAHIHTHIHISIN